MGKTIERKYKFGDYCLDTAKSIVESHYSMNDIFEVLHDTRDVKLKEKLVSFIELYLDYIEHCIEQANSLLSTLPFVIGFMNDIVDIKELKSTRDKLIVIKRDTEIRLKHLR